MRGSLHESDAGVLVEADQQQPDRGGEQRDPGHVDARAVLPAPDRARQHARDHRHRGDADREVDEEDPAPAGLVGEEAADQRPGDEAQAHQAGEHALERGAAATGVEVGDEDEREAFERARAEALQPAPGDQLRHVLRRGRQRRAEQEERHPDQQQRAPPVPVGEPRVHRQRHGRRHEVGGDDPQVGRPPVEVAHDHGQRRPDDRLVEHREQQAGDDGGEQQALPLRGDRRVGTHMSEITCRN